MAGCWLWLPLPLLAELRVVTTIAMITDIVEEVGGEKVMVEGLIGEGVDPHLYNPTRRDVVALQRADIIFYNGLHLEGKMGDLFVRMARQGKAVYAVTERVLENEPYLLEDAESSIDPHVWMDVSGWQSAVAVVADVLTREDPGNADLYRERAGQYKARLAALHAYGKEAIASIPESQRVLITAHDAFQYFGRAYDITVKGIQGISTESEAGLNDIERLVDYIVTNNIPAVFVESSVSDKNVMALIEGARAKGHKLKIGGTLYSDAMGKAGTYTGTYIGMLDHNITTIARSLGGEAAGFKTLESQMVQTN